MFDDDADLWNKAEAAGMIVLTITGEGAVVKIAGKTAKVIKSTKKLKVIKGVFKDLKIEKNGSLKVELSKGKGKLIKFN